MRPIPTIAVAAIVGAASSVITHRIIVPAPGPEPTTTNLPQDTAPDTSVQDQIDTHQGLIRSALRMINAVQQQLPESATLSVDSPMALHGILTPLGPWAIMVDSVTDQAGSYHVQLHVANLSAGLVDNCAWTARWFEDERLSATETARIEVGSASGRWARFPSGQWRKTSIVLPCSPAHLRGFELSLQPLSITLPAPSQ